MSVYGRMQAAIGTLQGMDWTPDGVYTVNMREVHYVTLSKIKRNVAKALSDNGLCVQYEYSRPEWIPKATEVKPHHILIEMIATIYDEEGDSMAVHTWGEGATKDEKAVSIARAFQMRAFLIDTFLISDYIEAEGDEPDPYVPTETAKQILAKKAVPQETVPKTSVRPMAVQPEIPSKPKETPVKGVKPTSEAESPDPPAVKPSEPVKTAPAAETSDKPLSAIQKKALENMRATVNDSIDKGVMSHNDSVLILDALSAIDTDSRFRQFMAVKKEFGL